MQPKFKRVFEIVTIALALAASGCAMHHPHARHAGSAEGSGLSVVGNGEAKGAPDIARSSIGIEVRADTAEAATKQANEQMSAVLAAIKANGVADTDLRTHDFSVSFERDYTPPVPVAIAPAPADSGKAARTGAGAAPAPVAPPASSVPRGSYRVSNTVEVTVRDVSKVSAVLGAATSAGANNVWGVNFDVSDREPLHTKAREQAIARAKQSAAQLAQLTGVTLGRIITIDDQADVGQIQPRMYAAAKMNRSGDADVPVEGGELTITHQVRLVYDLAGN